MNNNYDMRSVLSAIEGVDRRSRLMFGIFVIFIIAVTVFLLTKIDNAISEIEQISRTSPYQQARRMLEESPGVIDMSAWKTYRNEKYRFEVRYPNTYDVIQTQIPKERRAGLVRTLTTYKETKILRAVESFTAPAEIEGYENFYIDIFNLQLYTFLSGVVPIEYIYDALTNTWLESDGKTQKPSSLVEKYNVGGEIKGFRLGEGDAGFIITIVAIPYAKNNVMIEFSFPFGPLTESAPMDGILSTFKFIK